MSASRCASYLLAFLSATSITAFADTYYGATFSGGINPGGANVSGPFTSVLVQGGPVTGSFIYDQLQVPGAGTGYTNVFFSSFPDSGKIPGSAAFDLNLGGGLEFNLGSALTEPWGTQDAAIQYKNGNFNGFFFVSNFLFQGLSYQLNVQGPSFSIKLLSPEGYATGKSLVNGHLDSGLDNVKPYALPEPPEPPVSPVPEPGTPALLGFGLIGLAIATLRQQRRGVARVG